MLGCFWHGALAEHGLGSTRAIRQRSTETQPDARATERRRFDHQYRAMPLRDLGHDRQPQPAAISLAAGPVEPFRDARALGFGDTCTVIVHPHLHALGIPL